MQYKPDIAEIPDIPSDKLPVSEIFYSIQGEGRFAGYPSVFIRLMYCNLGCSWCDTRFTWDSSNLDRYSLFDNSKIVNKVKEILSDTDSNHDNIRVIITGGEPMIHREKLPSLIEKLNQTGFLMVDIETNGMFEPSDRLCDMVSWWNCSPKLLNINVDSKISIVPNALVKLSKTNKVDFKFVVQEPKDIEQITQTFLDYIKPEQIMLMPEGWTQTMQLKGMKWVMEECKKRNFRFSPRLHILIWNNKRGK
ncbi:MAG: 7-carboxy-7-deazaguanine synthase [Candidatus Zixiibacteriota bacterium]|nr:MAG: 7-carboxy-7-deazaguanine synthase [candidate division Zixibacteria bacterium]